MRELELGKIGLTLPEVRELTLLFPIPALATRPSSSSSSCVYPGLTQGGAWRDGAVVLGATVRQWLTVVVGGVGQVEPGGGLFRRGVIVILTVFKSSL